MIRKQWICSVATCLALTALACGGGGSESNQEEVDAGPVAVTDGGEGAGEDAGAPPADPIRGVPGAESTDEQCGNGLDDDESGYADCDDFWCSGTATVQVCGTLENTDALCSDGLDNPESPTGKSYSDGLVDCADPDCLKSPRVTACAHLNPRQWESGEGCGDGLDNDRDGLADCDDPDCWVAGTRCSLNGRTRVLFDNAHRQRAGNADWVVDISGRLPWPSVPKVESDWSGALSSMGKALFDSGRYTVETLTPHETLSYGIEAAQDLRNYGVLVIAEPSVNFTESEARAVEAFVHAGGGLLMVADHFESDRDGNGWDSVQAFNDLFTRVSAEGLGDNPFGFSVVEVGYEASKAIEQKNGGEAVTLAEGAAEHPVLAGVHGQVARVGMFKGGLFAIHDAKKVRALVHALPIGAAGYGAGSPFVVVSEPGAGRVVAIGDSAILNDGTDSHGRRDASSDAWNSTTEQNAALVLNAIEWLAKNDGAE